MDKINELEGKEKQREKSRQYYKKNSDRVKKRVTNNYRIKRAQLMNNLGHTCQFCGESNKDKLNFHHKIPMEVYENKIYHYLRNQDILLLLCVDCHVMWHNVMDYLGIDDIYKE